MYSGDFVIVPIMYCHFNNLPHFLLLKKIYNFILNVTARYAELSSKTKFSVV